MTKPTTIDEYLAALPEPLREVGAKARDLVDVALPDVGSALWHGHPTWSAGAAPGKAPVCFLKAYTSYVTFGFWRGRAVDDPSGRFAPGAREKASVKLYGLADVDAVLFTGWLHQALALEAQEPPSV